MLFEISINCYNTSFQIYVAWSPPLKTPHMPRPQEGLHLLVFDSSRGTLLRSSKHSTSQLASANDMADQMGRIGHGRIVVVAGVVRVKRIYNFSKGSHSSQHVQ